jgi:hypothetical protein
MLNRRKRTILEIIAVVGVLGVLSIFVFMPDSSDRWAVMNTRLTELRAEARSRKLPRTVLHGTPVEGNAWDEYQIALNDAETWKEDPNGAMLGRFVSGDATVDRALMDRMMSDHAKALEHLRLGARKSDGQYPYKWEDGAQAEIPSLLAIRKLANFGVAQARIWRESGRTTEAADLLLDVSMFARDVGANGVLLTSLIGDAVYLATFNELRNLILSGKSTRAQLADLERKLETLDHDFPSIRPALTNTNLSVMDPAIEPLPVGKWVELASQGGWRYGFSMRGMTLAAFEERESYMRRTKNLEKTEFGAFKKEADAMDAEALSSKNPLIRMSTPSIARSIAAHGEALARLRLLRAATGFLVTGSVPAVPDPFGTNLLYEDTGTKMRIWSVGSDGVDQKGPGVWSTAPRQLDIVLEIPK